MGGKNQDQADCYEQKDYALCTGAPAPLEFAVSAGVSSRRLGGVPLQFVQAALVRVPRFLLHFEPPQHASRKVLVGKLLVKAGEHVVGGQAAVWVLNFPA
jgi:hypothetical protein